MFARTQQPKKLYALVSTADNFFSADAQILRALHALKLSSNTEVIFDNRKDFPSSSEYCGRRRTYITDYDGADKDIAEDIITNKESTRVAVFVYIPSRDTRSNVEEILGRCSYSGILSEERKIF